MKSSFKYLLSAALAAGVFLIARAQPQPTNTVSITNITVSNGTVKEITIINPGSGYTTDPQVTIKGDGINATATASRGAGGTSVTQIDVTNGGSGYSSTPTVTIAAPEATGGVNATAYATLGGTSAAIPNESFGPAGTMIIVSALAVGTTPASGFTYEFFVDGTSIGVVTPNPPNGSPGRVGWTPPRPGAYFITCKATGIGDPVTSLPVRYFATGTMITSPTQNTIVPYGSSVALQATATPQPLSVGGNNAFVRRIDFYADGVLIGSDDSYPYSLIYTPSNPPTANTPNIKHVVQALAFDNNNNLVTGNASLDLYMVPPIGTPPTCVITSPANGSIIPIGAPVTVAVAAGSPAPEVKITKVELYIDGVLTGTSTAFPYSFSWTPTVVGNYRLLALAYDDKSNVVASTVAPASTIVTAAASPTISVLSPADGASLALGAPVALTAAANDSNVGGSVTRVQFFVDGKFVGESSTPSGNQFSATWTPATSGPASITAVATNQVGLRGTSAARAVTVLSAPSDDSGSSGGGGGTASQDLVVEGSIFGGDQPGSFTAVNSGGGSSVLFIGSVAVNGTTRSFFFSGIQVSDTGTFSATNAAGQSVSGTFSPTGAFGTLNPGELGFSGTIIQGSSPVAQGYYTGTISNRPNATLTAIVAPDRSITLLTTEAGNVTTAKGVVSSSGAFTIPTSNGTFTGTVSPTTGFVTGTITGGGTFTAASASDISASNGFLRNISTLGQVGTGANALTAGFYVGGTQSKQILIRAVGGASLSAFGIGSTLANPQLALFNSLGLQVANNDDWGGNAAIDSASTQVGAFGLSSASSTDAAVLVNLAPGSYTAQVTGAGGTSGTAIIELYDTDTVAAFSTKRLINLSTRGQVSPSRGLTAGFIINGTSSKTVLIRGAGPGLGAVAPGLSVLADPSLRLVRVVGTGNVTVRENDNWEVGNDSALVSAAAKSVGAFPFAAGSKDAAILINLPPGVYTADLLGATTGLALIEVYEVP